MKIEKYRYIIGFLSLIWTVLIGHELCFHSYLWYLNSDYIETDVFRQMDFGKTGLESLNQFAQEQQLPLEEVVTVYMVLYGYHLPNLKGKIMCLSEYIQKREYFRQISSVAFQKLEDAYGAVLNDLETFPIPEHTNSKIHFVTYENSWKEERKYGGDRFHEGCDIMGMEYARGFYPVCSISGGIVEQKGWLEQGGWRVGIRAEHGGYFYYAHLYCYAEGIEVGEAIVPGQLLGWMGDSGYSKTKGAVGNFPVHLHLGIYLKTDHYEEMSVNPYYILRYLQKTNLRKATYG